MKITLILGTARKERQSEKVARYVLAEIRKLGHEVDFLDVVDFLLERTDNTVTSDKAKFMLKNKILRCSCDRISRIQSWISWRIEIDAGYVL
jgi:multimeric flavodoxin WrbA